MAKTVTDIVGETFRLWEVNDEIVLDCQTGSGKTYFVLNFLHKYAEENDVAILYLYNRKAVGNQQKSTMLEQITQSPLLISEIENLCWLGNMHFQSYQGLIKKIKEKDHIEEWSKYKFVIFDEAHFLLADSEFNSDIIFLLEQIKQNSRTIRIWISATFDETWDFLIRHLQIFPSINRNFKNEMDLREIFFHEKLPTGLKNEELTIWDFNSESTFYGLRKNKIWYYKNPRDYAYINEIIIFSNLEECASLLEKIEMNEKALVFVAAKKMGVDLSKKIKGKSLRIINADTVQKNPEDMLEILSEEVFKEDILISTKVIDNGVNLQDENLLHIFMIGIIDKTDFLQMLGRKRRGSNHITLYLQDIKKEDLENRLVKEQEKLYVCSFSKKQMLENIVNPKWNHIIGKAWMYIEKTDNWKLNGPYYEKIKNRVTFLKKCLQRIEEGEVSGFPEIAAEWLDKDLKVKNGQVGRKKDEFLEFLENYEGKELDKSEQKEFQKKFKLNSSEFIAKTVKCRNDREWGLKKMNEYLKTAGLGYFVESENRKDGTIWKVVKKN